jgi:retron-type reverse transcriptase
LESGLIPNEWKSAKIVPIHKAGSRSIMDNFRPISVLPTISKVLERVVHRQLMSYLSDNKLLSEHQYGFRPKMSTELASIKLVDDIRLNVDKGNLVGAMFIDLTKAFDTVNHSQLLNKLPQYGVHGKELDWFKDYLFQRMVRVAYNGNLSQESYSFIGVPQG